MSLKGKLCAALMILHIAGATAAAQEPAQSDSSPYADGIITCEEARAKPELVFPPDGIDLGSGYGSPNEVDFDCKESLAVLPLLDELRKLSDQIRGDGTRSDQCGGSLFSALSRYHLFDLLEAGMAPRLALARREKELERAKFYPQSVDANLYAYFETWSYASLSNFRLHRDFINERDRVLPRLARHFRSQGLTANEAAAAAQLGVHRLLRWSVGGIAMPVDTHTLDVAAHVIKNPAASGDLDPRDLQLALQVSLLNRLSIKQIDSLLERGASLNAGEESPLFFALEQPAVVRHLVSRGADVDYANPFGKTPLFYAIQTNDHKLVALLLKMGARADHTYASSSPNADQYDCRYNLTHTNRTTLMHAAQHADVKMIKMLLKAGAPLAASDGMSYNATDYALEAKQKANADYLTSLGLRSGMVAARQKRRACSQKAVAAKLKYPALSQFVAECVRAD